MDRKSLCFALVWGLVGLGLFFAGWRAQDWYHHKIQLGKHRLVKKEGFRFTSPLLDIKFPEGVTIYNDPIPFRYKLAQLVKQREDGVTIRNISVYYRDLLDGPWIGINEQKAFNPASMMKVPVMIAWLKRAETDPKELKRSFIFDGSDDMSAYQSIKPARTLVRGTSYTVEELLHYMTSYSDNNATSLLYYNLKQSELDEIMDNMDVNNTIVNGYNSVSITGYSGFFRILYNATFLNRAMSEKALQLLSYEDFPQGFVAGVPKGTVMATKFGEADTSAQSGDKQLHEFGIIYHPKGHYILGVMTQGNDYVRQAEVLREISSLVYKEVDATTIRTIR